MGNFKSPSGRQRDVLVASVAAAILTSSILLGCKTTRNGSAVKVIGGVEDYQSHPAAVGLLLGDADGVSSACTGTVVRDDLILTAAHCLASENITKAVPFKRIERSASADFNNEKFSESEFVLFPTYNKAPGLATVGTDVAFIVYPKGTLSGFEQSRFSKVPAKKDDVVSIVGYGDTGFKDDYSNPQLKRFSGQNVIADVDRDYSDVILCASGGVGFTTAGLGQGDSGGPLFNAQGEIIGVSKANVMELPETIHRPHNSYISENNKLYSLYLNIANPSVAEFIAAVMKDPRPSKATVIGIKGTAINRSDDQSAFLECDINHFCKDGWGWLASGESSCKAGAPGWIAEKNGCSCKCK